MEIIDITAGSVIFSSVGILGVLIFKGIAAAYMIITILLLLVISISTYYLIHRISKLNNYETNIEHIGTNGHWKDRLALKVLSKTYH